MSKKTEIDEFLAVFLDEGEQVIGQFAKAAGDALTEGMDDDFAKYDESKAKADADENKDPDDDGDDPDTGSEGDPAPAGDGDPNPKDATDTPDETDDPPSQAQQMAKGVAVQDATAVLERLDKRFAYIAQKLEAQDHENQALRGEVKDLRTFAKAQSATLAVFAKSQHGGMQVMAKAVSGLYDRPTKPVTGRFVVPSLEDDNSDAVAANTVFAKAVNVVDDPVRVRQLEAAYNSNKTDTAALFALLTPDERQQVQAN